MTWKRRRVSRVAAKFRTVLVVFGQVVVESGSVQKGNVGAWLGGLCIL